MHTFRISGVYLPQIKNINAMKLKGFLFGLICFILIPTNVFSIHVSDKNWGDLDDRSIPSEPILSQDANNIYIYSEKQLDNLSIEIKDLSGNVVYSTVTTVPAGVEYPISIATLPKGEYFFTIAEDNNYMIGYFIK